MTKKPCDILIGLRGGDWYPFAASGRGTKAIRDKIIRVSYGENLLAAQLACDQAGLRWLMETEDDEPAVKLVDAMGQLIGQARLYSALETVANTISGFTLSFLVNLYGFPLLGIHMAAGPSAVITGILTGSPLPVAISGVAFSIGFT